MQQATVTFEDGRQIVVPVKVTDVVAWERYAQLNDLDAFSPISMAVFQAFNACRRTGNIDDGMPFDVFTDQLDGMPKIETAQPGPTRKGRGGGSSSK